MHGNPYELLGISMAATEAEIKVAYRKLVALYHPDNNPGFPAEATQKVRELNEAYTQARAGWKPPVGTAAGTYGPRPPHENPPRRWDPPKPPPKPFGPQVPPPKYTDVPPPRSGPPKERSSAAAADRAARTAALIGDLVEVGFFARTDDAAVDHAVVDAFLPLFADGTHLRSCARYDECLVRGEAPTRRHQHEFLHAVPSLAIGGIQARQEAIDRIVRAQFVACTDDHILWTVSSFAPGDGILLQEDIDVFSVPFASLARHDRRKSDVQLTTVGGEAIAFRLERRAAERLVAALPE